MSQTTAPQTAGPSRIAFDHGAEDHHPDLYRYDAIASGVEGFDAIGPRELQQYHEQGYLVVHHAFTPAQVQAALDGLADLIAARGKAPYELMFEAKVAGKVEQLDAAQREQAVRKCFQFYGADARLDAIADHPQLHALLRQLGLSQPKLFQAMALLKGPGGREKPWHQDHAYFNQPVTDRVVGVWIALDETTPANGCMHLMPRQLQPQIHFKRRDWQICDTDIQQQAAPRVAVPLQPGGMLLFDSLLPHGTPTNHTQLRRRALQYHYHNADAGKMTTEERLAIFGSEGKNVEC